MRELEITRLSQKLSYSVEHGGVVFYQCVLGLVWRCRPFTPKAGGKSLVTYVHSQRRCNMRHELLTQRALFLYWSQYKKGTLSQHFVTHVVPPLVQTRSCHTYSGLSPCEYHYGIVNSH